jgi:hypothetical protein
MILYYSNTNIILTKKNCFKIKPRFNLLFTHIENDVVVFFFVKNDLVVFFLVQECIN